MSKVVVVVDTREKEPYSFSPDHIRVVRQALSAGDYSLQGMEHLIAVERKSLDDFVHTVVSSRERFRKELLEMRNHEAACVVVEASFQDVLSGLYCSGAHPNSVIGSALSIIVDYNIPIFFCSNRQAARLFVEEYLLRFHRKVTRQCR
jgi:DNA excision repair protein ERCC-4